MNIFIFVRTHKKAIISSLIVLACIVGIFFISSHGLLETSASDIKSTFYTRIDDKNHTKKSFRGDLFLPSGDYLIESEFKDGNIEFRQLSIPRFMQKITIEQKDMTYQTTTLANNGGDFAGPVSSAGVETFSYTGGVGYSDFKTRNLVSKLSNLPKFDNFIYLSESKIAGYIQSPDTITPFIYSFTTDSVNYLTPVSIKSPTTPAIITKISSEIFCIYTRDTGLRLFSINNENSPQKEILFNNQKPALFNEKPLISTSKSSIALINGPDRLLSSDGEVFNDSNKFSLKLFSLSGKKQFEYPVATDLIKSISVSEDGKHIAIKKSSSLEIIDSSNGVVKYLLPESVEDFKWLNQSKFIFTTTNDHLVFIGDISGVAYSLYPKGSLSATSLSNADSNTAIFSAIPTNNGIKINPNLYKINTNTTLKRNTVSSLPHQGEGYYIYELNNIIYIRLTRYINSSGVSIDESSRKSAYEYLKNNGLEKNNIVEEFIDLDTRS